MTSIATTESLTAAANIKHQSTPLSTLFTLVSPLCHAPTLYIYPPPSKLHLQPIKDSLPIQAMPTSAAPLPSVLSSPPVHTHHCHCTTLLLATTYDLAALPRRRSPGQDGALILPLPPLPRSARSPSLSPSPEPETFRRQEDESADDPASSRDLSHSFEKRQQKPQHQQEEEEGEEEEKGHLGYSLIISTHLAPKSVIVRREDGFEKRRLVRCGRCRTVVGYQLDVVHYADKSEGARGRLLYLLPRALVTTEEMRRGDRAGGDMDNGEPA